ncbi:MAG: hypothetical protein KF824_07910 [Fimbriimonadaceae bacterium]|nr:MAG: hypothetical protein KF824_07910 [Fimbriimonadaceae bacterium]
MRRTLLTLMTSALMLAGGGSVAQGDRVGDTLRRVLNDKFDFTGTMVARRQQWDEEPMLMAIQVSKDKGSKSTVIHPSTSQGQVFIDDGKVLKQYIPDQKTILVRPSFYTFFPSGDTLAKWAEQNYKVTITDSSGTRLGRPVMTLSLKAKYSEMGTRVMIVDQQLPLTHVYEATAEGRTIKLFELVDLKLANGGEISLDPDVPREVRSKQIWGPKAVKDMKYAASLLGFRPLQVDRMPFNFQIFVQQLVGSESNPFFVTRMSDGLATAHVYQWKYNGGQTPETFGIKVRKVDRRRDIALAIAGDCPPNASDQILDAFIASQ